MKITFIFLFIILSSLPSIAQEIAYSTPTRDDLLYAYGPDSYKSEQTETYKFDIIGKFHSNVLIYKKIRYKRLLSIYDDQMKLKGDVKLDFLPSNVISVEFVKCSDRVDAIYQFQKRKVFYCMAAVIDENGKIIKEPFQLDSSHIKFIADLKLYHIASSEDRSKIMIYKIYKGDVFTGDGFFDFTTSLFNDSLQLIHKSQIHTFFERDNDVFSDFLVANDGTFVFTKGTKLETTYFFNELMLVIKSPMQDNFSLHRLYLSGNLLDPVDLRIDNVNQRYIINSLFCKNRNGNKNGLYTAIWSKKTDSLVAENILSFRDTASSTATTQAIAAHEFAYYYLKHAILTKDGGFILVAEDLDTPAGYLLSWDMPEYPIFFSSSYVFSSFKQLRNAFHKNILILCFDNKADLLWSNAIMKPQNNGARATSYTAINAGNKIHFLYDEHVRANEVMNEQTLTSDGELSDKFVLRNIDLSYDLLSGNGKQVSDNEMIFPCLHGHYTCFAKVEY
jgi:hypothetical protein